MTTRLEVRDGERSWRPVVAFVLSGLLGGALAAVLAAATMPRPSTFEDISPMPFLVGGAAVASGVLGGWFVAILVLARTHGGVRCPRCGTVNARGFMACRACELRPA